MRETASLRMQLTCLCGSLGRFRHRGSREKRSARGDDAVGLQVPARTGLAQKAALKQKAGSECFMLSMKVRSTASSLLLCPLTNTTR